MYAFGNSEIEMKSTINNVFHIVNAQQLKLKPYGVTICVKIGLDEVKYLHHISFEEC